MVVDYSTCPGSYDSFVETNGVFATFDVPGADATFTTGINDEGQVTGYYYLSSAGNQGFIATPSATTAVPEPTSAALLALGVGGLGRCGRSRTTGGLVPCSPAPQDSLTVAALICRSSRRGTGGKEHAGVSGD